MKQRYLLVLGSFFPALTYAFLTGLQGMRDGQGFFRELRMRSKEIFTFYGSALFSGMITYTYMNTLPKGE